MPDDLNTLRHIEGFPIGEDADILALSDPPHYTAYPNPHIAEFIAQWGKPYDEATDDYHREPYVTDVSEGKNDPIYNAHSYHTKVPYKAIIPFIEHYTEPGDIIFDGFCGSGMTGVAAQMAGRRAILCDLSPAATFIARGHTAPFAASQFEAAATSILQQVEAECGHLYNTSDGDKRIGSVDYTVWSDVFICPYCGTHFSLWDAAVDLSAGTLLDPFLCLHCGATLTKSALQRVYNDDGRAQQVPCLVNYTVAGRRTERSPNLFDIQKLEDIETTSIPYWQPVVRLPDGHNTRQPMQSHGIQYTHEFFTKRTLWVLAVFWARTNSVDDSRLQLLLRFLVTGSMLKLSRRLLFEPARLGGGSVMTGALYLPSLTWEKNAIDFLDRRIRRVVRMLELTNRIPENSCSITTQSTTNLPQVPSNSVDYVFTDPPYGGNLMYSELNIVWESWLRVLTHNSGEAIINDYQNKSLDSYRDLMTAAFSEMHRILKPGRWITVVFHNSKASVWNAIQEALARAGFLVAQVTVMDKQQSSFKQMTSTGAVKNDLIISAYKPRARFAERFLSTAGHQLEAEFVRQHLQQLPLAVNAERSREMLYSKYLAYYVQHGYQVAYNGDQFYRALAQWGLVERDGYWFADEAQANAYETRNTQHATRRRRDQAVLFISDERSARQWLWNFLAASQSYSDIYTAYVKALQTSEDELPELRTMLEEGFIPVGSQWRRPDTLTQAELERRRQERLLRQFEEYLTTAKGGRPLKEVRKEALVAGFTEAYRAGRYADILAVGRKLPKRLLEDSPDIYDFVDIAAAKVEG